MLCYAMLGRRAHRVDVVDEELCHVGRERRPAGDEALRARALPVRGVLCYALLLQLCYDLGCSYAMS